MIRFFSRIIQDDNKFERFAYVALDIIIIGFLLIAFQVIDGVKIRPIVEFTQNVDSKNFQLDKSVYHRGETVKFYTSFCKKRNAMAVTEWSLINDEYIQLVKTGPRQLPIGCYPTNQNGLLLVEIAEIPEDAKDGSHYIVGVTTQRFRTIFGKYKEVEVHYKTQEFIVE